MMHNRLFLITLLTLLSCNDYPGIPVPEVRPLRSIEPAALMAHINALAHDSMRGRGSGTVDEFRAAQYIEAQLKAVGYPRAELVPFNVPPEKVGGQTEVVSRNVRAHLTGVPPLSAQTIVIGAHYDHVGVRSSFGTTAIFNGADDNASGIAVLIEVARLIAEHSSNGGFGDAPRRSLLFMAFGAEEVGLVGSDFYCAHPHIPLWATTAMVNFDMVGRLRNRTLGVGGLSTSTVWSTIFAQQNTEQLVIQANDCNNCTDYACFRQRGVPALWFFTGLHDEYHQPGDDPELINADGLSDVADLAARVIAQLMVLPKGLEN